MPSGRFGANAAWWAITILAHNLHAVMQHLVLGAGGWVATHPPAIDDPNRPHSASDKGRGETLRACLDAGHAPDPLIPSCDGWTLIVWRKTA